MGFRDRISRTVKTLKHKKAMAEMRQAQNEAVREKKQQAQLKQLNYELEKAKKKAKLEKQISQRKKQLSHYRKPTFSGLDFGGMDLGLGAGTNRKKKKKDNMFADAFNFRL